MDINYDEVSKRLASLRSLGYVRYSLLEVLTPSGKVIDKESAERELRRPMVLGDVDQIEALKTLEFLDCARVTASGDGRVPMPLRFIRNPYSQHVYAF